MCYTFSIGEASKKDDGERKFVWNQLGAHPVLVGRPVLWGLAVDGADGFQQVLEILNAELERAMKLAGCQEQVESCLRLR